MTTKKVVWQVVIRNGGEITGTQRCRTRHDAETFLTLWRENEDNADAWIELQRNGKVVPWSVWTWNT